MFTGLSVGVTVVIAEYIGKDETDDIHSVVLTAMLIALVSGVFLLGVGMLVAEPVLALMQTIRNGSGGAISAYIFCWNALRYAL